ncbi:TetR/AcrR family transcriptional regulator [Clostridium pasteurianum]|uniref:Transcriptional regulator n=1 Tax=Clostridium pasteurianum BC1 TaxID=86416 RepID=R4K0J8_CLOPA|nr:TetR/AcrR family transcriptional regulator [Clostridium pasteurianum]AGK95311.1 transcriptional regulator [Clostridium pasteurianum BC1]
MDKISYHHDNLKNDLIEKGLELLNEEGYKNFSLRKVAKSCGVSHTAPYRHFKNKDELIVAITLEALQKFNDSLKVAVKKYPDDIKSQIKEMGFLYVKFFVENPEYLQLLFLSDILKFINKNNILPNHSNHPFLTFFNAIEAFSLEQKNTSTNINFDKNAYALECWGKVHGLAILIARKEYPYEGNYLELVRKIIWNEHK